MLLTENSLTVQKIRTSVLSLRWIQLTSRSKPYKDLLVTAAFVADFIYRPNIIQSAWD